MSSGTGGVLQVTLAQSAAATETNGAYGNETVVFVDSLFVCENDGTSRLLHKQPRAPSSHALAPAHFVNHSSHVLHSSRVFFSHASPAHFPAWLEVECPYISRLCMCSVVHDGRLLTGIACLPDILRCALTVLVLHVQ